MNDEDSIQEMQDFYAQACEYADIACKHLVLEISLEKRPLPDPADFEGKTEADLMLEYLKHIPGAMARSNPAAYTKSEYYPKFVIHYLFPNLSGEDRLMIEETSLEVSHFLQFLNGKGDDQEMQARKELRKQIKAMKMFESKLTAVQMALLDSLFCNPDSDVEFDR